MAIKEVFLLYIDEHKNQRIYIRHIGGFRLWHESAVYLATIPSRYGYRLGTLSSLPYSGAHSGTYGAPKGATLQTVGCRAYAAVAYGGDDGCYIVDSL